MLRKTYDWTMRLAAHPHALAWLALIACIESIFFPIPPDVMIIPMVLAARERAWKIATVATAASAVGGIVGYGLGYFLYEEVGRPIIDFYGYAAKYAIFQGWYEEYGAWIVGAGGFTPVPYKVITIASGVVHLDFTTFLVVSILSRGARFFIVAALLWRFGAPIRGFIEARLGLLALLFFVILFLGFIAIGLAAK
jgi:membrane protein YqaA with SNARE-associated domain